MDDNPATQDSKTLASYKQGDGGAEVVGLENPPCAAPRAAQEDLGDGTASGHRRNGAGFYGFGVSVARRFRTASAVWRRREEAEGSAESAAAVSARVEGVERVEGVARTPSSPGDRNPCSRVDLFHCEPHLNMR